MLLSLLASIVINVLVLATYPRLSLDRNLRERQIDAPVLRIEHRRILHSHPRPRARPRPEPKPRSAVVAAVPRHHIERKRQAPKQKTIAAALPRAPHRHPRLDASPKMGTKVEYAQTASFNTQAARLNLPSNWSTQNLANGAAADTTLWLDMKHARGATVPRVFLLHLKTTYMSGPTLGDAIHDIVENLRGDGARVYVSKAQPLCAGKHEGWFLSYQKPQEDPPMQFEDRLVLKGDTVYMATYSRPNGQPEDAKTRAALDTLCPLSDS